MHTCDLLTVLSGGENGDDVSVGDRRMDQNARCVDVRHDGHEVDGLMGRRLFHLQSVCQTTMVVAGVSHTADDGDRYFFNTDLTIEAVDSPDKASRVAGSQL